MYHFFEIKETALSLMIPNVGSKWKRKKDAVKYIFSIPLMKYSWYALKHCLVYVKEDKRACYTTNKAAIVASCIRGILEYPYKSGKTRNE
jgi:hypothetical protein